ncbi:MAG TPA: SRPBCC domain-containing protein [Anaerolineales bacterium]|nr:SRPBCC domain-containing protein [Anaerolineales bacterium]
MENTKIQALPGKQEIIVTRTYHAPRELIYRTVTDPKLIPDWWGPRNLTTDVERMEVRPGGLWRFIQKDPQGNIFAFHGVYHETKAPERLVYTFEWEGMPGHVLLDIESFEELNGVTTCISKSVFETVEDRDGMLQQGMEDGINEITDRLTELLKRLNPAGMMQSGMPTHHTNGSSLKITRIINAPRNLVWQRWTRPNDYLCWTGPKDYSGCDSKIDLRVGGKYLTCMESPDGQKIWSTGVYKEIIEPNRFVCTDSFADEHGNIVPASYYGMQGEFPLELEVEVTLEDMDGKTLMTLEHCGLPDGDILEQTKQGWNESFDKLEECITESRNK